MRTGSQCTDSKCNGKPIKVPLPNKARLPTRKRWRKWLLGVGIFALLSIGVRLWPHPPLKNAATYSRTVSAQNGELLRMTLSSDAHYRIWVPLEEISGPLVQSILLKEDRYFFWHPGVNPRALIRAAFATYVDGDRQGGSTISMQLARRLYDIKSRHVTGKLQQILMALWLEARYSKHDILEAYLNLAPMGGNIEGVEAASQIYFHQSAHELSLSEALALAVIPQNPSVRGHFGENLQTARSMLMRQWQETYPDDPRTISLIDLPITVWKRQDLPFFAPHYTDMLLAQHHEQHIEGTLDLVLQQELEKIVAQFVQERKPRGVYNAAVLLVDTRDVSVKAMVGSANYLNREIQGQVNGTTARRSPGSTVKPFLYALAIDQGIIHPMSMLKDAPSTFGYFRPENFDGRFVGPIPAQDALIRSRNIPAVWLASQTHKPSLHQFLKQAGVTGLKPEEYYGLTLALGGGEIKMTELAALYVLLAKDGQIRPLRYIQQDPLQQGKPLITPAAAFITRDMLQHNPRPDGLPPDPRHRTWPIAWKTGTSWGYHDAWSAGIIGPYVLVVWVGNFDSIPNSEFIGIKTAAPLFFRIADALPLLKPDITAPTTKVPSGVSRIEVCLASGDLPNTWCPQTTKTWFIPGVSPIRVSTLHQPLMIDTRTGQAACPPYDRQYVREEIFEFWPSELQQMFAAAGLPRRQPPLQGLDCLHPAVAGEKPQIKSPVSNVTYTLKLNSPGSTIALKAHAAADVKKIYWFNGQRLLGQTAPGETFEWRPDQPGWQELTASDEHGRTSSKRVQVAFIP